jgi:hypothetical protein
MHELGVRPVEVYVFAAFALATGTDDANRPAILVYDR